jgi:hypothetical protein
VKLSRREFEAEQLEETFRGVAVETANLQEREVARHVVQLVWLKAAGWRDQVGLPQEMASKHLGRTGGTAVKEERRPGQVQANEKGRDPLVRLRSSSASTSFALNRSKAQRNHLLSGHLLSS